MKSKLLIIALLSLSNLISQNTTDIFVDHFYSNINDWYEGSDEKRSFSIRDGYYYFEHKQPKKSWNTFQIIEIDQSKDFVIETKIKKISGIDNNGFGLLWGRLDNENQFEFYISSNGYFRINKKNSEIKNWEKNSLINQGNGAINTLKIEKKGNFLNFYINSKYVYSTTFIPFYGDKLGFHIENNQKIAIDYLKVYYLNKKQNYNSNSIIFEETFSNNNKDWIVGTNEDRSFDISYGKYYFEHKRNTGSWLTHKGITINTKKDFKIESNIQKVSGVDNYGYGLIWGRKDNDNEFEFMLSGNGYFRIISSDNGKTNDIVAWTTSSFIKQNNGATNKLEIVKTGNNLKFYINTNLVHTTTFKPFYGNRIGFSVYNKQKIGIDNFKVSYLNSKNITESSFVFNDQFNSNTKYWPTTNNSSIHDYFYDGKYYFNKKSESGGEYKTIYASIDSSKDFQIDTKLNKISGEENSGYGLIFGRKDAENQFLFNITASGYYRISKFENGTYTNLIDWATTSYINKNNGGSNKLTIKKQNGKYKFYINDNYVNSIDYTPFYGNYVGYVVFATQKFSADYLTIKYLNLTIKPNINVVVNNDSSEYLLKEEFNNNELGWSVENNENYKTTISGGKYNIQHKRESGGWYFGKYTEIKNQKDFEVETTYKRIASTDNGSVGFVFAKKDDDNKFEFFISKNGSYLLRKYVDGKKTIIFDWIESSYIATGFAPNTIKIKKSGSTFRFYINNQYVNKTTINSLPGFKFGWVIYNRTKIAVDNLKIKYLDLNYNNPPEIEIIEPAVVSRGFKIVKSKKITVKGKAIDSDGIYEVTINGIDAYVSANGDFNADIPLKFGDNELIVKASDIKGKSTTKKFFIKRESPVIIVNNNDDIVVTTNSGKYYALLIGISDYGDTKIVDLEGLPNKDAEGLATLLKSKYNFKAENVKVLVNANRAVILNAFDDLRKKLTDNDNLLIFYAGHGVYEDDSEVGYWLPADAEKDYTANWIQNSVVVSSIKRIKAKHTLLISDACFSGSIFKSRGLTVDAPKAYKKLYGLPSRKAITSGTLKTVPNKSVFYKYLTDRLRNNKAKYMSALELFTNIKIPVANNSPNVPQYGVIHGIGDEGGDFIFIKK